MTFELLLRFTGLLFGFILVGSLACLPLYKWNIGRFIHTSLFIKIIWWIPIFVVLTLLLYGEAFAAIIVMGAIIIVSTYEFIKNKAQTSLIARSYFSAFIIWILHLAAWFFVLPHQQGVLLLAGVTLSSVLSDVFAFFLGNYVGKHHLPQWLNNHKSWEGVAGQIIGALIGSWISALVLGIALPLPVIIAIGIASAVGDLANSAAKRSLSIKDWGNTIPGHGGFLDRLSSLSLAITVSLWLLYFSL